MFPESWSIILAGGDGERMREVIEHWLGLPRPKQYCTFVGTRSMFQHTVDRADRVCRPQHRIIVAASHHRRDVLVQLEGRKRSLVLFQPRNCGTAAGILLALTHLRQRSPNATATILPSDHFICPEERFLTVLRSAESVVQRRPDKIVVMGACPDGPETDYGWIEPGSVCYVEGAHELRTVEGFKEKPSAAAARRALASGSFWNTLVLAARVDTLWNLCKRLVPTNVRFFEELANALNTANEEAILENIYRHMPACDFSADVLQLAREHLLVLPLHNVTWSDWGRPERVIQSLERAGRAPAFASEVSVTAATRMRNVAVEEEGTTAQV
ncbi:MAG: mannose-1-phosphate guanylyltransferase [Acidobacteriota bacterium]|nr:MAG: mannose-1-phosphate guanylyltransferase [Acidobacteriota bacterium]